MNIAILCGGKGTRLKSVSKGKPKILIPIKNSPFVYLLFDSLVNNGFKKIYLLTSYKSESIKKEIGNSYKGVPIYYIEDNDKLKNGTASAIYNAIDKLPEHFLLQYGDTILNIDYKDFFKKSINLKNMILMSIYRNENNIDKNNVCFENNKLIYLNSESNHNFEIIKSANFIDYGLLGIKKSFLIKHLNFLKENASLKYFQEKISYLNLIQPYTTYKRFFEIGTPKSYEAFQNAYLKGEINGLIYSNND